MASVFTQIIEGKLPGHFVWKDDVVVAFMTIQPIRPGHLLVVPRAEIDHWDDVEPAAAAHAIKVAQKIAKSIKLVFPATRVGMLIAGLEVPHTHIHLIPIDTMMDFDLSKAAMADADTLSAAADKIRQALRSAGHAEAEFA